MSKDRALEIVINAIHEGRLSLSYVMRVLDDDRDEKLLAEPQIERVKYSQLMKEPTHD